MSGQSGSPLRRLLVFLAVLLAAFSAALVYVPERIPSPLLWTVRETSNVDTQTTLLFVGAAVAVVGLLSLWVWRAEGRSERLADRRTEKPDREAAIVGRNLTEAVDRRPTAASGDATREDGPLADRLNDVLVEVYTHTHDERPAAERHVEEGNWTTDRYAAAFVSRRETLDYPGYFRLFAWLYPEVAYGYRAKRALRAVETACETELPRYEAPGRSTGWHEQLWSVLRPRTESRSADEDVGGE